ncbi:NlpC/P60 family protein [Rhodoligotrophos defluvii]|uniref:NlpC/P60 family protein n=1 Tax=Rhodoligotrophos defluvii TaxID=2561934 RepID=UPI001EF0A945|nr:NlpC/P60 family protein [Rhodoligotrophos defluvii]
MPGPDDIAEASLAAARAWIGTPFHHGASLRGVGCDCLGLIRGVWRDVYGLEPEPSPVYGRKWHLAGRERLLEGLRRHLMEIPIEHARSADVLCFRAREGGFARHAGIMSAADRMIHAYERAPLCEVHLTDWWWERAVGAFRFPYSADTNACCGIRAISR